MSEIVAKRGRGRPPGSKNKDCIEDYQPPAKRSRGRPSGSKNKPRVSRVSTATEHQSPMQTVGKSQLLHGAIDSPIRIIGKFFVVNNLMLITF